MAEGTVAWQPDGSVRTLAPFSWARHPATISPWALRRALTAIDLEPGGLLIDPFAGSGTTGTLACARGDRFFGIEAHPLTASLARVKFMRPGVADELRKMGEEVVRTARRRSHTQSIDGEHEALRETLPLGLLNALAALRDSAEAAGPWADHVRWAVLAALRDIAGSRWPRTAPARTWTMDAPYDLVGRRIGRMADDLETAPRGPAASIVHGDARRPEAWTLEPGMSDACVSSPPYFNQVAYAEAPRLEMYFLGMASDWAGLQAEASLLMRSCVQQVTSAAADDAWRRLEAIPRAREQIERTSIAFRLAARPRPQPKRYDLLLPAYCADLAEVLSRLWCALRPGGRVAWVVGESAPYGERLDTPGLVAIIAGELGFVTRSDSVVAMRGHRWRGVGRRHTLPLTERLVVFERPETWYQPSLPGLAPET